MMRSCALVSSKQRSVSLGWSSRIIVPRDWWLTVRSPVLPRTFPCRIAVPILLSWMSGSARPSFLLRSAFAPSFWMWPKLTGAFAFACAIKAFCVSVTGVSCTAVPLFLSQLRCTRQQFLLESHGRPSCPAYRLTHKLWFVSHSGCIYVDDLLALLEATTAALWSGTLVVLLRRSSHRASSGSAGASTSLLKQERVLQLIRFLFLLCLTSLPFRWNRVGSGSRRPPLAAPSGMSRRNRRNPFVSGNHF